MIRSTVFCVNLRSRRDSSKFRYTTGYFFIILFCLTYIMEIIAYVVPEEEEQKEEEAK